MGEPAEGRCDKIADFSPSYSWVDFGEPFRRPTQKKHSQALSWGVQNQLGASKNAVKQKNSPLSLWGSTAPGCPGALAASPAWVNMSTGSAMGWGVGRRRYTFGGHVGIVSGSFWNYFGIIVG